VGLGECFRYFDKASWWANALVHGIVEDPVRRQKQTAQIEDGVEAASALPKELASEEETEKQSAEKVAAEAEKVAVERRTKERRQPGNAEKKEVEEKRKKARERELRGDKTACGR